MKTIEKNTSWNFSYLEKSLAGYKGRFSNIFKRNTLEVSVNISSMSNFDYQDNKRVDF